MIIDVNIFFVFWFYSSLFLTCKKDQCSLAGIIIVLVLSVNIYQIPVYKIHSINFRRLQLRYFNFELWLKLDIATFMIYYESQIRVTTKGFILQSSYMQCSINHWTRKFSGLHNSIVCKKFAVQSLLWSLGFVIFK